MSGTLTTLGLGQASPHDGNVVGGPDAPLILRRPSPSATIEKLTAEITVSKGIGVVQVVRDMVEAVPVVPEEIGGNVV